MASPENVDEAEIFPGAENTLIMMQTYTHKFQCLYDLYRYPFDVQTCSIQMVVRTLDRGSVALIPNYVNMNQSLDMAIFQINNWRLCEESNLDGLSLLLILKRKVMSELMTTYFPSLLLIAITFATTFTSRPSLRQL